MKNINRLLLVIMVAIAGAQFCQAQLSGQKYDSSEEFVLNIFGASIGYNSVGFIDSYLSNQKYEGSWPNVALQMIRTTAKNKLEIGLSSGASEQISNYGLASEFSFGNIWANYFFPVKSFNKKFERINLSIGPGLSYTNYWMSQTLAAVSPTASEKVFTALNLCGSLSYSISPKIVADFQAKSSIVCLIAEKVDLSKYHEYKPEWVSIPNGQSYSSELDILWRPLRYLGLQAGYKAQWIATEKWNKFRLFNQQFSIGLLLVIEK